LRRPAGASKSYASSGSTRGPEGGTEMAQKVRPNNSFKPDAAPRRGLIQALGGEGLPSLVNL
jgi:hypothetical protein